MKHRLFLRNTYGVGGTEKYILDWLEGVDYTKNKVTIASNPKVFLRLVETKELPVEIVPLPPAFEGSFGTVFYKWFRYFRRLRPDSIIIVEGGFPDFPLATVLAAYLSSRGNLYTTLHTLPPPPPRKKSRLHFGLIPGLGLWWYMTIWSARAKGYLSRKVLAVSESVKARIVQDYGYPETRTQVIYHGVDTGRLSPTNKPLNEWKQGHHIPRSSRVITCASRLSPEKRLDWVIKAFAHLAASDKDIHLVIAGDGPLANELAALCSRKGVSDRVTFLGHLKDVTLLLQASDVYVLTTTVGAFGLGLIEAMACGTVCLTTSNPGPSEIVVDGFNGILCNPTEEGVLRGLQRIVALGIEEKEFITRNARETVKNKFEIGSSVTEALSLLGIESRLGA